MKKLIFVMAVVLGFGMASCGNGSKKQAAEETTTQEEVTTANIDVAKAMYLEDILAQADSLEGKEIILKGKITHTCKHSGRRCFIVGKDGKTSIRVEAKGNIGGFNRELIGSEVAVKGTLHAIKMSEKDIDAMETEYKKKAAEAKEEGHCDTELKNVQAMRDWMKENNKEFYSIYYMDGMEFEVVE